MLEIVIHSLYTDKEIFVRELISNAADASEKLKFLQTSGAEIIEPDAPLKIGVSTDDQAKTITFTDAGIGMTHGELIDNLGTIAHSGSKAFLEQLKASKGDANLIGQFGVGFYSAFMVAEKVTVFTRSYQPGEQGWIWTSDGQSGYEIEPAGEVSRGTVVLQPATRSRAGVASSRSSGITRTSCRSHRAQRQRGEHGAGAVDEIEERDQRRGLRGVLQARRARHRGADLPAALQRRRAARRSARCSSCRRRA